MIEGSGTRVLLFLYPFGKYSFKLMMTFPTSCRFYRRVLILSLNFQEFPQQIYSRGFFVSPIASGVPSSNLLSAIFLCPASLHFLRHLEIGYWPTWQSTDDPPPPPVLSLSRPCPWLQATSSSRTWRRRTAGTTSVWPRIWPEWSSLTWPHSQSTVGTLQQCCAESIECIIEDQAFSPSYDLAPPTPPSPSPVSKLDRQHTGKTEKES